MPSTVNGIGTTYYGKKNVQVEMGACESCGKLAQLESYDTMLWFVVVFIPLIPLGRKRILNYCPLCTRHRVLALKEWERIRREAVREGMDQTRDKPDDPAALMKLHGTLSGVGQRAEAEKLAEVLRSRFPDDEQVQLHLGGWYCRIGKEAEGDACFARALEINPESLPARRAVGVAAIQAGDLARARELIFHPEAAGPHNAPDVLFLLAQAHQKKGEHAEALEVFKRIAANHPEIAAKDRLFRKAARVSEKAAGRPGEAAPPWRFPWRRAGLAAGAAAVVLLLFFGVNGYLRTRQTLHVLNHLGAAATITLPGRKPIEVPAGAQLSVTLPEGAYTAAVTGAIDERVEVNIRCDFWERFYGGQAFVLNVGGAAALVEETVTYRPRGRQAVEPESRLLIGERFVNRHGIDYLFVDPPASLKANETRDLRKRCLYVVELTPVQALILFERAGTPLALRRAYLESHLRAAPAAEVLHYAYLRLIERDPDRRSAVEFLRQGLARKPVEVLWHRTYQQVRVREADTAPLRAEYDAMLRESPADPALLYLRGRLASGAEAEAYYDRAIAADPASPWPLYAKALRLSGRGAFAEARPFIDRACAAAPDLLVMRDTRQEILLALKDVAALDAEAGRPGGDAPNRRIEARLLAGDRAGAEKLVADALSAGRDGSAQPDRLHARIQAQFAALTGDFEPLSRLAASADPLGQPLLFAIAIERGDPAQAERLIAAAGGPTVTVQLLLALAWRQAGDATRARETFEKVRRELLNGADTERAVAAFIAKPEGAPLTLIDDLGVRLSDKAVFCAALAAFCPTGRAALLDRAETLNFSLTFPHYFLDRCIRGMKAEPG